MRLSVLAHSGEIGWDELTLIVVAGLFLAAVAAVWLTSRRFKPVLENEEPTEGGQDTAGDSESDHLKA